MKTQNNNTLIILDWDDTLFPTSWVSKNSIDVYDKSVFIKYNLYFEELDDILYSLLTRLSKLGHVIIITNALTEWVKVSSSILPRSSKIIKNLKIISARKTYQNITSSSEWKKFAFKDELDDISKKNEIYNVVSVGDAEFEFYATINLVNYNNKRYYKTVKFIKNPSFDKLIEQLKTFYKASPVICQRRKHFDYKFKNFSDTNL